jgi:hypothetical protein
MWQYAGAGLAPSHFSLIHPIKSIFSPAEEDVAVNVGPFE